MSAVKDKLGLRYLNTGIFSKLHSLNNTKNEKDGLDKDFRQKLKNYFADDARKLKTHTGIDIWN
jgi:hypothetical protein